MHSGDGKLISQGAGVRTPLDSVSDGRAAHPASGKGGDAYTLMRINSRLSALMVAVIEKDKILHEGNA